MLRYLSLLVLGIFFINITLYTSSNLTFVPSHLRHRSVLPCLLLVLYPGFSLLLSVTNVREQCYPPRIICNISALLCDFLNKTPKKEMHLKRKVLLTLFEEISLWLFAPFFSCFSSYFLRSDSYRWSFLFLFSAGTSLKGTQCQ